jgi:hypothetical protein
MSMAGVRSRLCMSRALMSEGYTIYSKVSDCNPP